MSYIRRDKKDMRHIVSKTLQLPESEPSAGRDCACDVEVKTLIMKKAGSLPKDVIAQRRAQLWDLALPCSESGMQQPQASSQMPPLKPLPSTHYQNVDI
ncbi:hypothetical protein TURU_002181 [Turdus rufiventris]|nr:hypothetical protein TURU_002181 [Turdus rufiventris]